MVSSSRVRSLPTLSLGSNRVARSGNPSSQFNTTDSCGPWKWEDKGTLRRWIYPSQRFYPIQVLTSRIAHLILNCHIPPTAICAVTFTNKAANEMRERLTKLLGKMRVAQLKMGTFHSLCARFLRKYSKLVDIPENFTVCDASERCATQHTPAYMR